MKASEYKEECAQERRDTKKMTAKVTDGAGRDSTVGSGDAIEQMLVDFDVYAMGLLGDNAGGRKAKTKTASAKPKSQRRRASSTARKVHGDEATTSSEPDESTPELSEGIGGLFGESADGDRGTKQSSRAETASASKKVVPTRSGDPVRVYLRRMGAVPLLSREDEVEIAKAIETGELELLNALAISNSALRQIAKMGTRLEQGKMKLRDIVAFSEGPTPGTSEYEETSED